MLVASCHKSEVAVEKAELTGCDCKGPADYTVRDRLAGPLQECTEPSQS